MVTLTPDDYAMLDRESRRALDEFIADAFGLPATRCRILHIADDGCEAVFLEERDGKAFLRGGMPAEFTLTTAKLPPALHRRKAS